MFFRKYDIVDGYKVIRNKDKPWICTTHISFIDSFLGILPRMFIDTNHPKFIKNMMETYNSKGMQRILKEIEINNKI